jgi:flagellar biosynthesis anti-sigma factor FlgM
MKKPRNQGPGKDATPTKNNGNGTPAPPHLRSSSADLAGNNQLMEQVRQIIAATPEVRPEKVGPLKEAVDQGTYEIDARKVANSLITELILKP